MTSTLVAKETMVTISLPPLWVWATCGAILLAVVAAIIIWLVFRRRTP